MYNSKVSKMVKLNLLLLLLTVFHAVISTNNDTRRETEKQLAEKTVKEVKNTKVETESLSFLLNDTKVSTINPLLEKQRSFKNSIKKRRNKLSQAKDSIELRKKQVKYRTKKVSVAHSKCKNIKCSTEENPVCAKLNYKNDNKTKKPFYVIMINKCEIKYAQCHRDLEASIVPMSDCHPQLNRTHVFPTTDTGHRRSKREVKSVPKAKTTKKPNVKAVNKKKLSTKANPKIRNKRNPKSLINKDNKASNKNLNLKSVKSTTKTTVDKKSNDTNITSHEETRVEFLNKILKSINETYNQLFEKTYLERQNKTDKMELKSVDEATSNVKSKTQNNKTTNKGTPASKPTNKKSLKQSNLKSGTSKIVKSLNKARTGPTNLKAQNKQTKKRIGRDGEETVQQLLQDSDNLGTNVALNDNQDDEKKMEVTIEMDEDINLENVAPSQVSNVALNENQDDEEKKIELTLEMDDDIDIGNIAPSKGTNAQLNDDAPDDEKKMEITIEMDDDIDIGNIAPSQVTNAQLNEHSQDYEKKMEITIEMDDDIDIGNIAPSQGTNAQLNKPSQDDEKKMEITIEMDDDIDIEGVAQGTNAQLNENLEGDEKKIEITVEMDDDIDIENVAQQGTNAQFNDDSQNDEKKMEITVEIDDDIDLGNFAQPQGTNIEANDDTRGDEQKLEVTIEMDDDIGTENQGPSSVNEGSDVIEGSIEIPDMDNPGEDDSIKGSILIPDMGDPSQSGDAGDILEATIEINADDKVDFDQNELDNEVFNTDHDANIDGNDKEGALAYGGDDKVDKEQYQAECPRVCPIRDMMVCAMCQHGIYKTFPSICHLRMFQCQHDDEKDLELMTRYPCVMSAPYLVEKQMAPKGRVSEPDDTDRVMRYIRCRDKGKLGNGTKCTFDDSLKLNDEEITEATTTLAEY